MGYQRERGKLREEVTKGEERRDGGKGSTDEPRVGVKRVTGREGGYREDEVFVVGKWGVQKERELGQRWCYK